MRISPARIILSLIHIYPATRPKGTGADKSHSDTGPTAYPELSILIDVDREEQLNLPFVNLMQYPDKLLGRYLSETYPHLFPLDAWLDDGYFPDKQPAERISMPIHTHPSTDYVKTNFNEPIGRYETYYIAEAYEGANTWMGFYNDADLEEWEAK